MFELGMRSDTGKVRAINEDFCYAGTGIFRGSEYALLVVADGIGGHQAGDVASQTAIDTFRKEVARLLMQSEPLDVLGEAARMANRAVYSLAESNPSFAGMGTTLTAAMLWRGRIFAAHVGDTRLYLCTDGQCRQLTDDHSLVGELIKNGGLSEEEAQRHPQRNLIIRALGTEPEVEVDLLAEDAPQGDIVLLCSDGLSTLIGREVIANHLVLQGSLQAKADSLVDLANSLGGYDNITVVIAAWKGDAA